MIDQPKKAVTLFYDGETAPRLAAKGINDIAEKIIAIATEHNIPVREEPELVNILSRLKLGDKIPRELYVTVAEIIAFAYLLKSKIPKDASR